MPPPILPIFPLTGSLLLPGGLLPLNIFEQRYRFMVEDALAGGRHIGMIQPTMPNPADNTGEIADDPEPAGRPRVYAVGCAGLIQQHQTLPFGRYLIVLRGVCRFRTRRELTMERGYRRISADYEEFAGDLQDDQPTFSKTRLLEALRAFSDRRGVELEIDQLSDVPSVALLNGLAMSLPLAPVEKQALLEAADAEARFEMLLTLLDMGIVADESTHLTH